VHGAGRVHLVQRWRFVAVTSAQHARDFGSRFVVHGDDLVVATHGRSFWILDDASPLREMNAQVSAADLWLFKPAPAYRVRPGSDQGTPVPMDEALAENPPDGAVVDYWLKENARGQVQLEIFDADGKLVRRFSTDDLLPKTNPKNLPIAMEWVREAPPLSAEAGMHRFVWDLHYELPRSVHRSFYGPAGCGVCRELTQ